VYATHSLSSGPGRPRKRRKQYCVPGITAHRLTHRLYARYKEHYGTVLCQDVRKGVGGNCPQVVGRAARWAAEILIEEFGPA